MRIDWRDLYHGAALAQLVADERFVSLRKDAARSGLYSVNGAISILIKHATETRSDGKYQFTFTPEQLAALSVGDTERRAVVLVCAGEVIAGVVDGALDAVLDREAASDQWVTVEVPEGRQLRVRGSRGDGPLIPQNAYPAVLFEG